MSKMSAPMTSIMTGLMEVINRDVFRLSGKLGRQNNMTTRNDSVFMTY